jgi:hypothetical protein
VKNTNFLIYFIVVVFGFVGVLLLLDTRAAPVPVSNSNLPVVQKLSIFPGYGDAGGRVRHESIESQLGRKILYANGFASMGTWGGVANNTWGLFVDKTALFVTRKDVVAVFSFPLRTSTVSSEVTKPGGAEKIRQGLFDTANGANDAEFREIGERLVAAGQQNAILRIGGEYDIDFNPYSMLAGNEDAYIAAFRRAVDVVRSVPGNNFKIDYNGNGNAHRPYTSPRTGITQTHGQAAYPGNQWVDIIGVDVYDRNTWAVSLEKLNHALDLAKKYNKPFSVPEWGYGVFLAQAEETTRRLYRICTII